MRRTSALMGKARVKLAYQAKTNKSGTNESHLSE